jgi:hypothetical protein
MGTVLYDLEQLVVSDEFTESLSAGQYPSYSRAGFVQPFLCTIGKIPPLMYGWGYSGYLEHRFSPVLESHIGFLLLDTTAILWDIVSCFRGLQPCADTLILRKPFLKPSVDDAYQG